MLKISILSIELKCVKPSVGKPGYSHLVTSIKASASYKYFESFVTDFAIHLSAL